MNIKPQISVPSDPIEYRLWWNAIVRLGRAAKLRGVSKDTLRRNPQRPIIDLGKRAKGMRRGDALLLPPPR